MADTLSQRMPPGSVNSVQTDASRSADGNDTLPPALSPDTANPLRQRNEASGSRQHSHGVNIPGSGGFMQPERVARSFDLRPGMIVADFGAGAGYFTIPIARIIGDNGKVYAIDIQKNALDSIKARAALEHLLQVEPVWTDLELQNGSHLPASATDFVVVANILFQAEKKQEIFLEAARIVRSGGGLAVLEWNDSPLPAGPALALRVPKAEARRLAESAGFSLVREFGAGSHHYGLLFQKPAHHS